MTEKRLPKGISIRKDGRYQARYTLNGKRYTIYGNTLKEVEKKLRDAKYEIDWGKEVLKDGTDKEAVSGKEKAAVRYLKLCRCRHRKDRAACRRRETVPDG